MNLETMIARQDEVEREIAEIKAQLEIAVAHHQATGEYADPVWFAKARAALRYRGAEHQKLLRDIAKLKTDGRLAAFASKHGLSR
jgi:hypothetical protein